MPLSRDFPEFNRTNAIEIMLQSLRSDTEVKGLIFLPGATDELYLLKRVNPRFPTASATLLDAVSALTNGSSLRCSWSPPFVLIHSPTDVLDPVVELLDSAAREELLAPRTTGRLFCLDDDWDSVQDATRKHLSIPLLPAKGSKDSWHFYRHNLVGWDLSDWEGLEALALAGKTSVRVERSKGLLRSRLRALFLPDIRIKPAESATNASAGSQTIPRKRPEVDSLPHQHVEAQRQSGGSPKQRTEDTASLAQTGPSGGNR
jgi:hypothetical protein